MKINLNEVDVVYVPRKLKNIPNHSFFIYKKELYLKMAGHKCCETVVISICPSNLSQPGYECGVTTICCKIFNSKIVSFEYLCDDTIVELCEVINIEYCLTRN